MHQPGKVQGVRVSGQKLVGTANKIGAGGVRGSEGETVRKTYALKYDGCSLHVIPNGTNSWKGELWHKGALLFSVGFGDLSLTVMSVDTGRVLKEAIRREKSNHVQPAGLRNLQPTATRTGTGGIPSGKKIIIRVGPRRDPG